MMNILKNLLKQLWKLFVVFVTGLFFFELGLFTYGFYINENNKKRKAALEEEKELKINTRQAIVDKIRLNGDTATYKWFVDSCRNDSTSRFSRYLPYSIIMADKYNYLPAYYDAYKGLMDLYDPKYNLGEPDSLTRDMALLFLTKGAEKGDSTAIKELQRLNR